MEPRWAQIRKVAVPQLPLAQLMGCLRIAVAASPPSINFISSPVRLSYLRDGNGERARLSGMNRIIPETKALCGVLIVTSAARPGDHHCRRSHPRDCR